LLLFPLTARSCHPYEWILFKRRRARYFKIDRGLKGVDVPNWLRAEAE